MDETGKLVFRFFNEIGIINQLSSTLLNRLLPDGLHVSHFSVLNHMVRLGDGDTPLKLASAFQVSKATMTHTLTTLNKRGLIRLAPHETDGRSKVVFLTDQGRAFQAKAIESLFPKVAELQDQLNLKSIEQMLPELERIRILLDEDRND